VKGVVCGATLTACSAAGFISLVEILQKRV
jgi:hypothetical protein